MTRPKQPFTAADLYDAQGLRKYLTSRERRRFRTQAEKLPPLKRNFCLMLYYTGCRISEALELTPERIDLSSGVVIIRTLKRRRSNVYRAIPLPMDYLKTLVAMSEAKAPDERLWRFSRKTAYRTVKAVMRASDITGIHACPKGLRHGFGIACVEANILLPTIAKWMGHSSIETTSIYLNVIGKEERTLAKRTWK